MDLFDALGPDVGRELAERRDAVPAHYFVGREAVTQLASQLAAEHPGQRVGLVADARTMAVAGDDCAARLGEAGLGVHAHTVPDVAGHPPACDDTTLAALEAALPAVDVVVGVGSGVINDLSKWLATERGCPSAIVATAASMNGYAAANIAPAVGGVKTLVRGCAHRVIAADPAVLAAAPAEMTAAGLGDVIAKAVSTADWRINDMLFGEGYSAAVAGIIDRVERRFLADPAQLARGSHEAVSALLDALVYSGCAMTLQGSSMPASGGEHLISHALDMRAMAEGIDHDLHGRQVGVATIFVAALYARALSHEAPPARTAPLPLDRRAWGSIADEVAAHHAKQGARLAQAVDALAAPGMWQRVREAATPMVPSPEWVKGVLSAAGAAHRISDLGIDRERFRWAVLNGAQIRERFTSLDLAWATGVLPDAVDDIIDAYLL